MGIIQKRAKRSFLSSINISLQYLSLRCVVHLCILCVVSEIAIWHVKSIHLHLVYECYTQRQIEMKIILWGFCVCVLGFHTVLPGYFFIYIRERPQHQSCSSTMALQFCVQTGTQVMQSQCKDPTWLLISLVLNIFFFKKGCQTIIGTVQIRYSFSLDEVIIDNFHNMINVTGNTRKPCSFYILTF